MAATNQTGPANRHRAGHQTAAAPSDPAAYVGRGRHHEALEELSAAERLQSQMEGSHALASQVTGWMLATQARAGLPGEARARLAALDDQEARSGEVRNADAVICLAVAVSPAVT